VARITGAMVALVLLLSVHLRLLHLQQDHQQ